MFSLTISCLDIWQHLSWLHPVLSLLGKHLYFLWLCLCLYCILSPSFQRRTKNCPDSSPENNRQLLSLKWKSCVSGDSEDLWGRWWHCLSSLFPKVSYLHFSLPLFFIYKVIILEINEIMLWVIWSSAWSIRLCVSCHYFHIFGSYATLLAQSELLVS